jgi:hypothetical protein
MPHSSRSPFQTAHGTPKQHAPGGSASPSVHSLYTRSPSSTYNIPSYAERPCPSPPGSAGPLCLCRQLSYVPHPDSYLNIPKPPTSITNRHAAHAAPHLRKATNPHPNPPTPPRRRSCRNKAHRPEGAPACSHGCSERVLERAQPVDNEQTTPRPGRGGGISITTRAAAPALSLRPRR